MEQSSRMTVYKSPNSDHRIISELLSKQGKLALLDVCYILESTTDAKQFTFFIERLFQDTQLIKQIVGSALAPFHTSLPSQMRSTPLFRDFLTKNDDFYQLFVINCFEKKLSLTLLFDFVKDCPPQHLPTALAYFKAIVLPMVKYQYVYSSRIISYCKTNFIHSLTFIDIVDENIVTNTYHQEVFCVLCNIVFQQIQSKDKAIKILKKALIPPSYTEHQYVMNYCYNVLFIIKELQYEENKRYFNMFVFHLAQHIAYFRETVIQFSINKKIVDIYLQEDIFINCFDVMGKIIDIFSQVKEQIQSSAKEQLKYQSTLKQSQAINKQSIIKQEYTIIIKNVPFSPTQQNKNDQILLLMQLQCQVGNILKGLNNFRHSFEQQINLQLSSGQRIKRVGLVKFAYVGLLLRSFTLLKKYPQYEEYIDLNELNLLHFISQTLKENRWNNVMQLELQKLLQLLLQYEIGAKKQSLDQFLNFIIEHLINHVYMFLDSCRFTEQGDVVWLYLLAHRVTKLLSKELADSMKSPKYNESTESPSGRRYTLFSEENSTKFLNTSSIARKKISHFQYWFNFIKEIMPEISKRLEMGAKSKYFVGEYEGEENQILKLTIDDDLIGQIIISKFEQQKQKRLTKTGSFSSIDKLKYSNSAEKKINKKSLFQKVIEDDL